jgi:hypothetical protein
MVVDARSCSCRCQACCGWGWGRGCGITTQPTTTHTTYPHRHTYLGLLLALGRGHARRRLQLRLLQHRAACFWRSWFRCDQEEDDAKTKGQGGGRHHPPLKQPSNKRQTSRVRGSTLTCTCKERRTHGHTHTHTHTHDDDAYVPLPRLGFPGESITSPALLLLVLLGGLWGAAAGTRKAEAVGVCDCCDGLIEKRGAQQQQGASRRVSTSSSTEHTHRVGRRPTDCRSLSSRTYTHTHSPLRRNEARRAATRSRTPPRLPAAAGGLILVLGRATATCVCVMIGWRGCVCAVNRSNKTLSILPAPRTRCAVD